MGSAEVALAVSTLVGLVLAIGSFVLRDKIADLKTAQTRVAALETKVAVLEASELHETVADHTAKLQTLELGMGKIQSALDVVVKWVEKQEKG